MLVPKVQPKNGTANRIVEAAVQLFSRQGFAASSTHEIARLAGVSEVTIFRHFPRKRDLFWAATESRLRRLRISQELRRRLESDENPRTAIPGIVAMLVETVQHQPEMLRLLYLSLFELENGAERILRKHLVPGVATLGLAASVAAHQGLQQVFTRADLGYANTDEAIAAYSDFWMKALVPEAVAPTAAAIALP
jgi:AcrR family transcriptional regulator